MNITDEVRAKIAQVKKTAFERPNDIIDSLAGNGITETFNDYVVTFDRFNVTYTHDTFKSMFAEHLSVSTTEGDPPTPREVMMIADEFGFGDASTWAMVFPPGTLGFMKAAHIFKKLPEVPDKSKLN